MAAAKPSDVEQVSQFINVLEHPLKNVVERLRKIILLTDATISEHIKWNSPAFYYTGEMAPFDPKEYKRDIIVMHLRKPGHILLVFPTGAKVNDSSGILEGSYTDGRRMVTLKSMEDLALKERALQEIIKQWLRLIDK